MKKVLFIPILLLVLFSCSPDEETEAPTNTVQTSTPEPEAETPEPVVVQYTLTVTVSEGGSVTDGGTFDDGTEVTITATPNEGYQFVGWEGSTATEENLTITLNSNQDYQALFELIPPPNPISELDISNLEGIQGRDGYNFYYNISDNLPIDWINEFKIIMENLNSVIHITPRVKTSPRDGKDEMHIFAWRESEVLPFQDIIGNNKGYSISGNENSRFMVLEIENYEIQNNTNFIFSVIAHEYLHVYQKNASIVEPPYLKYLSEGGASTLQSIFSKQYYNYNRFTTGAFQNVTEVAISSPVLFETFNDEATDQNYSNSVFIFLALVKELQRQGNTEIEAFKKVFIDWWKSGRTDVTKEVLFEEVFGFSIDSFYLALKSYNPNINSVLPSQSISLQDIFTE
ncbi:hypothetical protein N9S80_03170 [Flavobacteriaceae bacterium]|nr:hypothetical protein [Flavobacteriaceae bacterium]